MDDDTLPAEFDLIVIGTGLTESIVAAAASRIGKTVLHLDANDYYGGQWASFNLDSIQSLIDSKSSNDCVIENAKHQWFVEESENQSTNESSDSNPNENNDVTANVVVWTKEKVMKDFRKFNIDLTPKLLFARGDLVELLISSNICRYAEFRALDKIVTLIDGNAMAVPCSRADVFTNKTVNVVEKRLLMKTLTDCLNGDDDLFKDFAGKTFRQYLESKRLTPNLIHYILYAIAMCDDDTPCDTGTRRTKQFLQSLGRYGNTPFLFPMYGCGEIPQCFCRLCAVFGGVYCLKRSVENIQIDDEQNEFRSINCNGQTIQAKALVLGNGGRIGGDDTATNIPFVPNDNVETIPMAEDKCGQLARAIYIVNKPLGDESLNSGGGGVNLIRLPAIDASNGGAFVIQLAHHSGTCPKDLYLVHITCKATGPLPAQDIQPFECQLFNATNKDTILWSAYCSIPSCIKCQQRPNKSSGNVHIACGPFCELDYDESIRQAQTMFHEIYPDEEFLPRAPDPEEIIIEGDAAPDTYNPGIAALIDAAEKFRVEDEGGTAVDYVRSSDTNCSNAGDCSSSDE